MGTHNSHLDFDHDDQLAWLADSSEDEFEGAYDEKPSRRNTRRKQRRTHRTRNRFSDYEGERWLKHHIADWDDYDSFDDEALQLTMTRCSSEEE